MAQNNHVSLSCSIFLELVKIPQWFVINLHMDLYEGSLSEGSSNRPDRGGITRSLSGPDEYCYFFSSKFGLVSQYRSFTPLCGVSLNCT